MDFIASNYDIELQMNLKFGIQSLVAHFSHLYALSPLIEFIIGESTLIHWNHTFHYFGMTGDTEN